MSEVDATEVHDAPLESGLGGRAKDGFVLPISILQLVWLAVYLVPRTAVLGAVLWTGYLGGAIARHVRVGNPMLGYTPCPCMSRR